MRVFRQIIILGSALYVFISVDAAQSEKGLCHQVIQDLALGMGLETAAMSADVILVGWTHDAKNTHIPELIRSHAELLTRNGFSFFIERHSEDSHTESSFWTNRAEYELVQRFYQLGRAVINADIPKRQTDLFKKPYSEWGMSIRDAFMARKILQHLASGEKAILLVGSDHVRGIARQLRYRGFRIHVIKTGFNFETAEPIVSDSVVIFESRSNWWSYFRDRMNPSKYFLDLNYRDQYEKAHARTMARILP